MLAHHFQTWNARHMKKQESGCSSVSAGSTSSDDESFAQGPTDVPRIVRGLHRYIRKMKWNKLNKGLVILQTYGSDEDIRSALTRSNKQGETPLHAMAADAPMPILLSLLDLIPARERCGYLVALDNNGNTPLHCLCRSIVSSDDFEMVVSMMTMCPEAMSVRNAEGDTPLHLFVTSHGYLKSNDVHAAETTRLKLQQETGPLGMYGMTNSRTVPTVLLVDNP